MALQAIDYEMLGLISAIDKSSCLRVVSCNHDENSFAAVFNRQVMFAFDKAGLPVGYWYWASVSKDVGLRLSSSPNHQLHISEWSEGPSIWMMGFACNRSYLKQVFRFIRASMSVAGSDIFVSRLHMRRGRKLSVWPTSTLAEYQDWALRSRIFVLPANSFATCYSHWSNNPNKPKQTF